MPLEVYGAYPDEVIILGKTDNWWQMVIQTTSTFYTPDDMCLQNNVLIKDVIRGGFFINLLRFTRQWVQRQLSNDVLILRKPVYETEKN